MEATKNVVYCQLVAQLLIIDGVLTDDERSFLESLMNDLALDSAQREEVFNGVNINDTIEGRLTKLSKDSIETLLTEVRAASAVDGDISPVERVLIGKIQSFLSGM